MENEVLKQYRERYHAVQEIAVTFPVPLAIAAANDEINN
jgi:hypothetical protein